VETVTAYLYMLRCADGSYYVGMTVAGLERRVAEQQAGAYDGYTASADRWSWCFTNPSRDWKRPPPPNTKSRAGAGTRRRL
jgi:predicted GIY-YIG superfamily endonuclease